MLIGRRYLIAAIFHLLLAALVGSYVRAGFAFPGIIQLNPNNLVHAHSHVAYFGWASLALMGGSYLLLSPRLGDRLAGSRWLGVQFWIINAATLGAFVAFALDGYNPVSIGFSIVNDLMWFAHATVFWLNYRRVPGPRPFALKALAVSAGYLIVAILGTLIVTVQNVGGMGDELWRYAGVYLFVHAFAEGWLIIGLMGLVAGIVPEIGRRLAGPLGMVAIAILAVATAPAFLVLLEPHGLAGIPLAVGGVALAVSLLPQLIFLFVAAAEAAAAARNRAGFPFLAAAWGFFAMRTLIQLFIVLWPEAIAWSQNRQIFIGYLHLELVGAATGTLMGFMYFWAVDAGLALARAHFAAYVVGGSGMIASLLLAGLTQLLGFTELTPPLLQVAFFASLILVGGIGAFMLAAGFSGRWREAADEH